MVLKNLIFIISSCFIFFFAATLQAQPESPWAVVKKANLPPEVKEYFFSYTVATESPDLEKVMFNRNFETKDPNHNIVNDLQWSDIWLSVSNWNGVSLYLVYPQVTQLFPGPSKKIPELGTLPPQYLLVSDFLWSHVKPQCVFFIRPLNDKKEFLKMVVVDLGNEKPQIRTKALTRTWLANNVKKKFWEELNNDDQDPGGDDPHQPEPVYVKNTRGELMDFAWDAFEISKGSLKWADNQKVEFELSVYDGQQNLQMAIP